MWVCWEKSTQKNLKKKISISKSGETGKHYPKMSERQRGEKNAFWRGGITPFTRKERARFQQTISKQVLKRDNYTCQLCNSKENLHVDHIQSWADYIELRFSLDNCRTLCVKCHYKITWGKPMPRESTWGRKNREI